MEKIRISVYEDSGTDEHGNELIRFSRDELIDIKLGIIAKEQDINIRITKIEENQITINADGHEYILHKEESIEFNCWTGNFIGDETSFEYFFIISWETLDILSYEETKLELNYDYLKEELE